MRQRVGNPGTGLSVLRKFVRTAKELRRAAGESEPLALDELVGTGLVVPLDEFRFVVEQIEMRRRAGHVQKDDVLGSWLEVWLPRCQRIDDGIRRRSVGTLGRQRGQRHPAQSHLAIAQKMAAGHKLGVL